MGAQDQEAGEPAGYCIEIKVGADGQITVSVEESQQETTEEPEGDANAHPVGSIKEACQLVMDLYKNSGQIQGVGAEQAAFDSAVPEQGGM
jgi:hypothetical protein